MTTILDQRKNIRTRKIITLAILAILVIVVFFLSLFIGNGKDFMSLVNGFFHKGSRIDEILVYNIALPRALAGLLVGSGLAISGVIMQVDLNNTMASPSTLGVSNAAVLGANLAITILSGGYFDSNNGSYWNMNNPYVVTIFAFIFSVICVLVILGMSAFKNFSPNTVILSGIALGAMFTAITTILQYFATDTQLAGMVYWSFGDLSRATYTDDYIILTVVLISFIYFMIYSFQFNALNQGDFTAKSLGVNVNMLRFVSLLLASLCTAVCISFVGIIGFLGILAPHIVRRIIGNDYRYLIPGSALMGALILLSSDLLSKVILKDLSLPVGAITSLFGAPFFLYIIFRRKENLN